jgi:hypothetical protein
MSLAAAERIDTWVFKVSVAVPLLCLAVLVVWHLLARLTRGMKKQRVYRHSPEPQRGSRSAERGAEEASDLRSAIFAPRSSSATVLADDPERLQQTCAALEGSLAQAYLDLAACWWRRGKARQAAAVWQQVVERCPQTPQADVARERLRQLAVQEDHS